MALRATKQARSLALTVSTTNCEKVRNRPYRKRLELVYDYLIEYDDSDGALPDVIGIENAIAYGVASAFKTCDSEGSPLYSVELASRHKVSKEGYCIPLNPANKCKVIRGVTNIRFDENESNIQSLAYDAIEGVLGAPEFLSQFVTIHYDRVAFVEMRSDSISQIAGSGKQGNSGSKVAIAAGTVSFLLAVIFLGGLFRKRHRQKKARITKQLEPGKGKRFLLGSAPRRYYELDEDQQNGSGFKVLELGGGEPYYENPSITWSVSDITSESGSILSNISRTTSKLERIEEVEDECPTDDEWDGADTHNCYDLSSPRQHVGQWDVAEESTDPEGCRYLDDSSRGSSSSSDGDDERYLTGLSGIENYLLECSDDSDDDDHDLEKDLAGLSEMERYIVPVLGEDDDDGGGDVNDVNDGDLNEPEQPSIVSEDSSIKYVNDDNVSVGSEDSSIKFVNDANVSVFNETEQPSIVSEDSSIKSEGTSVETRLVLHTSARDWDEISGTSASKWMIELIKELKKSHRRKLLTNGTEAPETSLEE